MSQMGYSNDVNQFWCSFKEVIRLTNWLLAYYHILTKRNQNDET